MVTHARLCHMCLLSAGLVDKLLDSNYHGNWVWVGFEIIPPEPFLNHYDTKLGFITKVDQNLEGARSGMSGSATVKSIRINA